MTSYIGRSMIRKEDIRFLKGQGRFVADIKVPGALEAMIFRSPVAHGKVLNLDLSAARNARGVVAVYGAQDLGPLGSMPTTFVPKPELERCFQRPIAVDKVRYVGEPLAIIVAEDRYAAEDALEHIAVDIEPLDVMVDARESRKAGRALVHESNGSNIADVLSARRGDIDAALRDSPVRLSASLSTHRHTGVPMETRGLVAYVDESTGMLTVWGPTKVIHRTRAILASLLRIPEERIRCLEPDVGGGFGFRGEFFPEDFLVPWAAMKLGRPVRWIEDRQEHFLATNHSRQQWHEVEVGFDERGRILAFRDHCMMDMGAYVRPNGLVAPTHTVSGLPGPYRVPAFDIRLECVLTNKTPHGSFRGPGQYESTFVRERVFDMMAARLGMDPADIRRINLVPPDAMPYATGTHEYGHEVVFDGGNYVRALDRALEVLGYQEARALQRERRALGRYVGVGIASYSEPSGLGGWEHSHVWLDRSGMVRACVGTASIGQGVETSLAQVAADATGASFDGVTICPGDTERLGRGQGAWGSRAAVMGGSAVLGAGRAFRQNMLAVAAWRFGVPAEALSIAEGRIWVTDEPSRSLTFSDVARLVHAPESELPAELAGGVEAEYTFEQSESTYPYGSAAALVEVDALTGAVQVLKYVMVADVGTQINPMIVRGQLIGAATQGVGGALLEELVHDEQGQLLTTTFADYLLPTASEMPEQIILETLDESRSPTNPLGAKGAGEGGIVASAAVLANAVTDALRPLGVEVAALPLSHDRLHALIRGGKKR